MTHPAFNRQKHRPWGIPKKPWTWRQSWCDLLFAHWPVPSAVLRPLVPEPLSIQEYDGTSWIGIVPFRMEGVMHRPFPDLPWISAFPELNVRLYVEYEDKPGVWFLSLDARNPLAVWAARRFFHLPYFKADIELREQNEQFYYQSSRQVQSGSVDFRGTYRAISDPYEAESGSLEHWLTERYCLYAESPDGELYRSEVHHWPWPLQRAEVEIKTNELLDPFGISLPNSPSLLHFASRLDVVIWPPERIAV